MSEPLFRVGGVYRNGLGRVVQVKYCHDPRVAAFRVGSMLADGSDYMPQTFHPDLSTGECETGNSNYALIPGELHAVDGAWVPVETNNVFASIDAWVAAKQKELREMAETAIFGYDLGEPASEPKRPPLDWNKPTPFDPFPGFAVTSTRFDADAPAVPAHSHALQRMSDTGSHQFGSMKR